MPRLGNPLVYDLLDVADALAEQGGRRNLQKAAMRRAVSSAYYAVFHGLCFVCARALGVWTRDAALVEPIYRLLDHGQVRKRLATREAAELGPVIAEIGVAFADLQDRRHKADHSPPGLDISRDATRIAVARKTIPDLESLDDDQRRRLAVLLITKTRLA
ncbi:hypothetical protein [Methylobacterium frigidaeris]|uniref:Uncharacterized protein n=1 Tax=Methylobacterium frigidaeris TaxID=2038277 RepID=A0AA37HGR0_9HYPH|nr:hypothetical protein [Methylobacterium frigidaeris]PIK74892.1 hypothetical protein CS379_00100 [Methylobacterium frigidaeris]GJD64875.1 hypothetical protein MPEAHAMD_5060 [Methylobacterium frigidaeris]